MTHYPAEFVRRIPKTDLHVHLDGSLREQTLIDIAKENKIDLPSYTPEGLNEIVFKPHYRNLDEYLRGFGLTNKVMQHAEHLERIAYELAIDNAAEGVRHLEVRFAPQLHISDQLSFERVMQAVDGGLRRARAEINASSREGEPEFDYGIIVIAMRFFMPNFSQYYRRLSTVHSYSDPAEVIQMASSELARATVKLRNETDLQIVAFDLAGSEHGYPAGDHEEAFDYIHKHFLKKTVHAGEAYGPESIFQAITKLHADRIGHGMRLFDPDHIRDDSITDRNQYIRRLVNYIADNRTTIEVCLTSNMQTAPDLTRVADHSLGRMLDEKLSVSFCTDNRLVSHTTVTDEIQLALDSFDISPKQLKNIIVYGFKRSFSFKQYPEKREYVRKVINYYEKLEREFGLSGDGRD
jgi:adenosine deaminase